MKSNSISRHKDQPGRPQPQQHAAAAISAPVLGPTHFQDHCSPAVQNATEFTSPKAALHYSRRQSRLTSTCSAADDPALPSSPNDDAHAPSPIEEVRCVGCPRPPSPQFLFSTLHAGGHSDERDSLVLNCFEDTQRRPRSIVSAEARSF